METLESNRKAGQGSSWTLAPEEEEEENLEKVVGKYSLL
jgi:hypothetical protein